MSQQECLGNGGSLNDVNSLTSAIRRYFHFRKLLSEILYRRLIILNYNYEQLLAFLPIDYLQND